MLLTLLIGYLRTGGIEIGFSFLYVWNMKFRILVFCFWLTVPLFAQVKGAVVEDGRKVLQDVNYEVNKSYYAKVYIDIAVTPEGVVTSATLNEKLSSTTSTPLSIECINRAKKIVFEKGYRYPKFHYGTVLFSVRPTEDQETEE